MKKKSPYLPIALKVKGKKLLIVGGGPVAYRKMGQWQERGALLTVVAAKLCVLFSANRLDDSVILLERPFQEEDLLGCDLVYIATADSVLNDLIEGLCHAQNIWCGRADDNCSDVLGLTLIEQGDIQIGIGTSGKSPGMARQLREQIETQVDLVNMEIKMGLMEALRKRLKEDVTEQSRRGTLLRRAQGFTIEELERLMADETIYSRYKG